MRLVAWLSFVAFMFPLIPTPALAAPQLTLQGLAFADNAGVRDGPYDVGPIEMPIGPIFVSASAFSGPQLGHGFGFADFGAIHLDAESESVASSPSSNFEGLFYLSGQWKDDITLACGAPFDGQCFMTVQLNFAAVRGAGTTAGVNCGNCNATAFHDAVFQVFSTTFGIETGRGEIVGDLNSNNGAPPTASGDPPGPFMVTFPFLDSEMVSFTGFLAVQAQSTGNGFAQVDAVNSFLWGGVVEVVDDANQPVAYSISSASGVDYNNPVPEPSAGLALVFGAAALCGLASQRRRRPVGS